MSRSIKTFLFFIIIMAAYPGYANDQAITFTLEQCIDYARKNNIVIKRAENAIKSAESSLAQSQTAVLPDLGVIVSPNLSYTTNNSLSESSDHTDANVTARLGSSVSLYDGGRQKNIILQNKYGLSVSDVAKQSEEALLDIEVLSAYINVLFAHEQLNNCTVRLQSTRKELEYASIRNSTGVISKTDYLNIKAQCASDKVDSVVAENAHHLALITLMQKINMPVTYSFAITEPVIDSLVNISNDIDVQHIYQKALENRPEIKRAQYNLASSNVGVEIAKAARRPSLALSTGVDGNTVSSKNENGSGRGVSGSLSASVGLSLSIPLYERGTAKNQITQARLTAESSKYSLDDAKYCLLISIEQVYSDLGGAHARYNAIQEQYTAELESYRLAEEMFGQGLINSVNYLLSKNNLAVVVNEMSQAKYAIVLYKKQIDYYLGNPITL